MTDTTDGVTLDKALATQQAMRAELGLGAETFPMPAFIGMLSDEIEHMRDAGHDDAAIAGFVARHSGMPVDAAAIARYYMGPEERHKD